MVIGTFQSIRMPSRISDSFCRPVIDVLPTIIVMAGLVPAIQPCLAASLKTWMPGTRPGMTEDDASSA